MRLKRRPVPFYIFDKGGRHEGFSKGTQRRYTDGSCRGVSDRLYTRNSRQGLPDGKESGLSLLLCIQKNTLKGGKDYVE